MGEGDKARETIGSWSSRRGWFTVIHDPVAPGGLAVTEITTKDTKVIRAVGGVLFDREGFSEEVLSKYSDLPEKKFTPFKRWRILIPPRMCECQYSGWKPYGDREI